MPAYLVQGQLRSDQQPPSNAVFPEESQTTLEAVYTIEVSDPQPLIVNAAGMTVCMRLFF
jgi:hypothetical protein